jgi:hypothetical protein
MAQGPERRGSFAERQPGGLPEQLGAGRVCHIVSAGERECGGLHVLGSQRAADQIGQPLVHGHDLIRGAGQRTQQM